MGTSRRVPLVEFLSQVPDPRRQCRNLRHPLPSVLTLAFCAILAGANSFREMELFCRSREDFFRGFLDLPHGIPSHETFARVLQAVDPRALVRALCEWLLDLRRRRAGELPEVVSIDGKASRGTHTEGKGQGVLQVVSAWASEQGLVLGQVAVEEKSNEIRAIPALLDLLELKGTVVTMDAAGCQQEIAAKIVAKGGDYILAVKGNQPTLHEQVTSYFEQVAESGEIEELAQHVEEERAHGRRETRRTIVARAPKQLRALPGWATVCTIVMVIRECLHEATGKLTSEIRYYVSSATQQVGVIAYAIRQHWSIEDGLHWVLDVVFREDEMRVRNRVLAQNLAAMNRLAVSLIRADKKNAKAGIRARRKKAGWDTSYLEYLLFEVPLPSK